MSWFASTFSTIEHAIFTNVFQNVCLLNFNDNISSTQKTNFLPDPIYKRQKSVQVCAKIPSCIVIINVSIIEFLKILKSIAPPHTYLHLLWRVPYNPRKSGSGSGPMRTSGGSHHPFPTRKFESHRSLSRVSYAWDNESNRLKPTENKRRIHKEHDSNLHLKIIHKF